jgi:hypothetical protein
VPLEEPLLLVLPEVLPLLVDALPLLPDPLLLDPLPPLLPPLPLPPLLLFPEPLLLPQAPPPTGRTANNAATHARRSRRDSPLLWSMRVSPLRGAQTPNTIAVPVHERSLREGVSPKWMTSGSRRGDARFGSRAFFSAKQST